MSDITTLHIEFTELDSQLRQAQSTQAGTQVGTAEWWELQRQIGDLRRRAGVAEVALLESQIAGLSPQARGGPQGVSWENRLYYLRQELKPPMSVPERTTGKWWPRDQDIRLGE